MTDSHARDVHANVSARGVVMSLVKRQNRSGRAWVTFTLSTPGGRLRCVCFPTSYESLGSVLRESRGITVRGQVSAGEPREMRVIEIDHA